MRKTLLPVIITLMAMPAWAAPVTQRQAIATAQAFFASKGITMTTEAMGKAYRAAATQATATYYVFNAGDNRGFAIVSGDDRTVPVLGYANQGALNPDSLPDNLKAWLKEYERQIDYLQTHDIQPVKSAAPASDKAVITPMLSTKWDQVSPYNDACPDFFTNKKSVTGCVATAMAQLLYYHAKHATNMVKQTQAEIPAYLCKTNWTGYGQISVAAIPAGTVIDWGNMLPSYNGSEPANKKQAVANLMLYCGAAVNMDYADETNGGSSATDAKMPKALISYFGFDKSVTVISRDQYAAADWNNAIYDELKAGRPVVYSGSSDKGSGHAFIIEGYGGDNYFDVNWGWSGYGNGKYLLNVLAPESGGTGAGTIGMGYKNSQQAIINAMPNQGGSPTVLLNVRNFTATGTKLSYQPYYLGNDPATFNYGYGLRNNDGSITAIGATRTVTLSLGQYSTSSMTLELSTAGLGKGVYEIVPAYKVDGTAAWKSMWSAAKYIAVTVDAQGHVTATEMPQTSVTASNLQVGPIRRTNMTMDVTADLTNTGSSLFAGALYLFASTDANNKGSAVAEGNTSLEAGSTGKVWLGFTPAKAGTYTLWLCADKGGNQVLTQLDGIVVTEGDAQTGACQIMAIAVENSIIGSTHEEGNNIVTDVTGNRLTGKYTIKAVQNIENKNVLASLYKYDEASSSFVKVVMNRISYNTITMGSGASVELSFDFQNLTSGLFKLKLACGTLNTTTFEIDNAIWTNETYCYRLGTATGIETVMDVDSDLVGVFGLNGVKVGESTRDGLGTLLRRLPRGIYIVDGRKVTVR